MRVLLGGDVPIEHRLNKLRQLSVGDVFQSQRLRDNLQLLKLSRRELLRLYGPHGRDRFLCPGKLRGRWCECVHGLLGGVLPERIYPAILHSMLGRLLHEHYRRNKLCQLPRG